MRHSSRRSATVSTLITLFSANVKNAYHQIPPFPFDWACNMLRIITILTLTNSAIPKYGSTDLFFFARRRALPDRILRHASKLSEISTRVVVCATFSIIIIGILLQIYSSRFTWYCAFTVFKSFYLTCNVCMFVRVESCNSILKQKSSADWAEILYTRLVWMTMHDKLFINIYIKR